VPRSEPDEEAFVKVLVTGCAGFIGSHLTEALLTDGIAVLGVDCFNENYGRREKLNNLEAARDWDDFDFVPVDLRRGELRDLVEECDAVYHLAAEPGVRSSWGSRFDQYLNNNVLATQLLLEAMRESPTKRFVYASSSSIYGEAEALPTPEDTRPRPRSPYGMTKLAGEHLCSLYHGNHGIDAVSLRYFSVFGPRQRPDMAFNIFCRAAISDEPITVFGDGRQTRDFTYVADVVAATRAAAAAPGVGGEVFNVGGGSRIGLADAIEHIGEVSGRPLRVQHLPMQDGDVRDTGADTTQAKARLGFTPSAVFADGLRAEFEWVASTMQPGELSR
jgi:UDP-glucuronate 4-epimerase